MQNVKALHSNSSENKHKLFKFVDERNDHVSCMHLCAAWKTHARASNHAFKFFILIHATNENEGCGHVFAFLRS